MNIEHPHGDIFEQITEPDVSPSLHQMVVTQTVAAMAVRSSAYSSPDYDADSEEDDDLAHDDPDYMKLHGLDIVDKEAFVEEWLLDPKNREKVEQKDPSAAAPTKEPEHKEPEKPE